MSRYKEDLSDVQGGDFELIPAGRYPVVVTNATIEQAKTSGNDIWKLEMEITAGRFAGRKLWLNISMIDKARPIRKGTLTALGVDTTQMVDYLDDVIGRKADAEVFVDEYQGNKREKVKRLRTPKTTAPEVSNDEFFADDDLPL